MERVTLFLLSFSLFGFFCIIKSYTPGGFVSRAKVQRRAEPLIWASSGLHVKWVHWFRQQNRFMFYLKPLALLCEWSLWAIHLFYEKRPELPEEQVQINIGIIIKTIELALHNTHQYIPYNTAEVNTNEWLWMFTEKYFKSTVGTPPHPPFVISVYC